MRHMGAGVLNWCLPTLRGRRCQCWWSRLNFYPLSSLKTLISLQVVSMVQPDYNDLSFSRNCIIQQRNENISNAIWTLKLIAGFW